MLEKIAKLVSEYSGFTLNEIKSSSRKDKLTSTRKVFTYFAKTYTNATYSEINKYLGYNDTISTNLNTAIDYNYRVVLDWISINQYIPDYFYTVENLIKSSSKDTKKVNSKLDSILVKELYAILNFQHKQKSKYVKKLILIEKIDEILKKYE